MNYPSGFLKRHTLFASFLLLAIMELIGHALWLTGVIPDNNTGGNVLYVFLPAVWLIATLVLVARKFI